MAQSGFTPIQLYYSITSTNVPSAGNLLAGELALNTADGKLFYKDSGGAVQVLGTKGGVGSSTTTEVLFNSTGLITGSANLTFDGTTLTAAGLSGPHNGTVGVTTPATGAFTSLSASGAVSGTGFSNYLASPPAIGGTVPAAGTFNALTNSALTAGRVVYVTTSGLLTDSANLTFNSSVLTSSFAGPMAATSLSASGSVTGTGFSNYLASPPAIGGTAPATGAFTTLTASSNFQGRINPRVSTAASATSITPDVSAFDQYCLTAQAVTLNINAPTGTPVDGSKLIIRILDNGTSRTLTWNATYTVIGTALPTATTTNKTLYVGCIYNAAATRWDVIAVTTQA